MCGQIQRAGVWGVFGPTTDLGKPGEVVDDGGGAAIDLHQRDLVLSRHQDVVLLVEHSGQVHTPGETTCTIYIYTVYICTPLTEKNQNRCHLNESTAPFGLVTAACF